MSEVDKLEEFKKASKDARIPDDVPLEPKGRKKSNAGDSFAKSAEMEEGSAATKFELTEEQEMLKMDEFWQQVKEIEDKLKLMKRLTEEIEKAHRTSLISTNPNESQASSTKVEELVRLASQASKKIRNNLKLIETTTEQVQALAPKGSGDLRIRKGTLQSLTKKFMQVMKSQQRMQETYKQKYDDQLVRQYRIVKPKATEEELLVLKQNPEVARQQIFSMATKEEARKDLAQMQTRYNDVALIHKSIMELAQMFQDIQNIVYSQSDIINKIEYNVDQTEEYTEAAKQDMKSAVQSQRSIQRKKWIITILIVIVVAILLGVAGYYISKMVKNVRQVTK